MHRISAVVRITLGLTCLSVAVLLMAKTLGLIPERRSAIVEGRAALSESIAIQGSMLAGRGQMSALDSLLKAIVERNQEVTYAAVRLDGGKRPIEVREPDSDFRISADGANDSYMTVPLSANGRPWGTLEIGFRPLARPGMWGYVTGPTVMLCSFAAIVSSIVFFFYLRKLLQDLDPSRVVPDRVRATLDTLAEGLLILDSNERIVLANQSFADTLGSTPQELMGRRVADLSWTSADDDHHELYPWSQTLQSGALHVATTMNLQLAENDRRTFKVNASPIFGDDGKPRGVLASFDDMTAIEQNREELQSMLELLKSSRDEVHRKNQELQLLATRDPLTGCLNRRSFFEAFEQHWGNSRRHDFSVGCVLLDIDHFKSINDQHGHSAGDQVLEKLSAVLHDKVRDGDLVCRYGGEEFCVLLPHVDVEVAAVAAERYRRAIEETQFAGLSVTSSFGVSASTLGAVDPQEMIDQADKSLYAAKHAGRNRVCRFDMLPEDFEISDGEDTPQPQKVADDKSVAIPFHAVTALVSALSYRDARTAEHSRRVADLCVMLASKVMSARETYVVEIGALLHDIGKIGVPDAILLKPGPLTDEEWKLMGLHDQVGVGIIRSSFDCQQLTEIVETHHAWFTGNPREPDLPTGLDIPTGARILSIADAFDAMVSDRVYRKGRSYEEAFVELRRCAGVQFDPDLVEPFIEGVMSRDTLRKHDTPRVSKQTALNIGLQIESLADAVDRQDGPSLAAHAEVLRSAALENGVTEIAELAEQLAEAATRDAELFELAQITNELLELCRATQTAYLSDEPEERHSCEATEEECDQGAGRVTVEAS